MICSIWIKVRCQTRLNSWNHNNLHENLKIWYILEFLDFNVNGISIFAGQEILKGTVVNLVVGRGLSEEYVVVPDLIGLNQTNIKFVKKFLNVKKYINSGLRKFAYEVRTSKYPTKKHSY